MLARSPAPTLEADRAAFVTVDYAHGWLMDAKGEAFNMLAFAPTREGLDQVMADYLVSHAKYEPRFFTGSIFPVDGGFVCSGRRYRYDVVGRT